MRKPDTHFKKFPTLFFRGVFLIVLIGMYNSVYPSIEAKRIKQSLKIKKEKNKKNKDEIDTENDSTYIYIDGIDPFEIIDSEGNGRYFYPKMIKYAGYEKEASSTKETFLVVNNSDEILKGFKVEIIYKDMKGRMLHKRTIQMDCDIPPKESRKFDIPSWDIQKTYYYHLGNTPKKVATPYDVEFISEGFKFEF